MDKWSKAAYIVSVPYFASVIAMASLAAMHTRTSSLEITRIETYLGLQQSDRQTAWVTFDDESVAKEVFAFYKNPQHCPMGFKQVVRLYLRPAYLSIERDKLPTVVLKKKKRKDWEFNID